MISILSIEKRKIILETTQLNIVRNKEKEREIGQQERKILSEHWTWGKISGEKEMGREPVKVS